MTASPPSPRSPGTRLPPSREAVDFRRGSDRHQNHAHPRRIADPTQAERDILRLLGTGLSNAEIAAQLHLSTRTVKPHISRILTRTNRTNRVQVAALAKKADPLD
ncbi:LuxR C-terminal-related transcriptional regulator [Streptomyces sp. AD2-2]|nr:LuxR C-terminal-related transcriptional regulator [Streptomyces sp. AD2-2]